MRQENFKKLSDLLQIFVKENGLEDGLTRVRIFKAWDIIVGERVAKATVNKFYKDGILFCTVNSSMIRSQLQFQTDSIQFNINKMLNNNLVNKIVIK